MQYKFDKNNNKYLPLEPGKQIFQKLSERQKAELNKIEPSVDKDISYHPCKITLSDGEIIDRVYIVDAKEYIHYWGVWPDQDKAKTCIKIEDVSKIEESPSRIPVKFANELYKAGESGMGYTVFTVMFKDKTAFSIITGNAIDFIEYPKGKTKEDILKVLPHKGREQAIRGPKYSWCLYTK